MQYITVTLMVLKLPLGKPHIHTFSRIYHTHERLLRGLALTGPHVYALFLRQVVYLSWQRVGRHLPPRRPVSAASVYLCAGTDSATSRVNSRRHLSPVPVVDGDIHIGVDDFARRSRRRRRTTC